MTLEDDALNSPDRNVRKEFLLQTAKSNELPLEKKITIFSTALADKYDTIRNLAIEYLCDLYEKSPSFDLKALFIPVLEKEPIWSVKYLILKKIAKFNLSVSDNKTLILKLTHELKPQIRLASAEVLLSFPDEQQDDEVINRLLELWKDKDESVRKQLEILLPESKNPKIKKFMADYEKKLKEKEAKKKSIMQDFDGI